MFNGLPDGQEHPTDLIFSTITYSTHSLIQQHYEGLTNTIVCSIIALITLWMRVGFNIIATFTVHLK